MTVTMDVLPDLAVLRPGLPAEEIAKLLRTFDRQTDVGNRGLAFYLAEMQQRSLMLRFGFKSAELYAQHRLDMSRRRARQLCAAGIALRELREIDAAFAAGELSWRRTRELTRIATAETEAEWLACAKASASARFDALVSQAAKGDKPKDDPRGLPTVKFAHHARLSVLDHEKVELARRQIAEERGEPVTDAELLVMGVESLLRKPKGEGEDAREPGAASGRPLYDIAVQCCTQCSEVKVTTEEGEVRLDAPIADATLCDAGLDPVTGRDRPTPPAMRRKVIARDGGRCVVCRTQRNLTGHHIEWLSRGGRTEMSNLTCLCADCHSLVHAGLLMVEGTAPHGLTFSDRDGEPLRERPDAEGTVRLVVEPRGVGTDCADAAGRLPEGPRLDDVIGQERVVTELRAATMVAGNAQQVIDPILFHGPPGTGKTTLARAVATELGAPATIVSAARIASAAELEELTQRLAPGSLLFIDETHALPQRAPEVLYEVMDSGKLHVLAATTDPARLPRPLFDRFAIKLELQHYGDADLARIVEGAATKVGLVLGASVAGILAAAGRGTPRQALAILQRIKNLILAAGASVLDADTARATLTALGIDPRGLDSTDRRILSLLRGSRQPVGLDTISRTLGLPPETILQVHEPFLLREGLIAITPYGRTATS